MSQRNIRLEDVFHAVSGQGSKDFALVFVTAGIKIKIGMKFTSLTFIEQYDGTV